MGTLHIKCPLCCNETFNSYDSLKSHLLNIFENLKCTACDKRCETLFELIEHIGEECCEENEKNSNAGDTSYEEIIIKHEDNDDEDQDDDNDSTSMLLQTLSDNHNINEIEDDDFNKNKMKDEAEEDLYYCSSCDVSFPSINDHINEFHVGQEVFLEVSAFLD